MHKRTCENEVWRTFSHDICTKYCLNNNLQRVRKHAIGRVTITIATVWWAWPPWPEAGDTRPIFVAQLYRSTKVAQHFTNVGDKSRATFRKWCRV